MLATIIITLVIVTFLVGVSSLCLCCCLIPLGFYKIIKYLMSNGTKNNNYEIQIMDLSPNISNKPNVHQYTVVPPSAPTIKDNELVEAYFISPLNHNTYKSNDYLTTLTLENDIVYDNDNNKTEAMFQLEFKDKWASLLFIINILVITSFTVKSLFINTNNQFIIYDDELSFNTIKIFTWFSLSFLLFSIILSIILLSILMRNSKYLITLTLKANIILFAITSISCLIFTGNVIAFLLFGLIALLSYFYYESVKPRIPFASAVLSTACKAVSDHYIGLITTSLLLLLMKILWLIDWYIAYKYINYYVTDRFDDNTINFITFILILSCLWGLEVIKYINQSTVAGTVAVWWFQPYRRVPVRGSLFRSITSSFGSICFGALVVSTVRTIRFIINLVRNKRNNRSRRTDEYECVLSYVLCCLEFIIRICENFIEYINKYALCYVAAYGYDFIESGKRVMQLFKRKEWLPIINDNMISNCFTLLAFTIVIILSIFGVLVSILFSGFVSKYTEISIVNAITSIFCLSIIVSVIVSMNIVEILDSSVAMIFVCNAENSEALKINHGNVYDDLFEVWNPYLPVANVDTISDYQYNSLRNLQPYSSNSRQYEPIATPIEGYRYSPVNTINNGHSTLYTDIDMPNYDFPNPYVPNNRF